MVTYKKRIDITPHTSTMPKMSQTGYTFPQAVSELVDNSIDARNNDQPISIDIVVNQKKGYISIVDDSSGMDEQAAENCLTMGMSSKKNQLGEFGFGLKTAALSIGKTFRIETTQQGSAKQYEIDFDEDEWLEKGDWNNFYLGVKEGVPLEKHKTKITISNFKNEIRKNSQDNLRKKLAESFSAYITNKEVKISVNKKLCKPKPEELILTEERPDGKEYFEYTMESGEKIRGWRGLLVKGALNDNGFRVYRNKRLIEQHQKIGFVQHAAYRHIIGELYLDHAPVTNNKREFIKASDFYQEVIKKDGPFWRSMENLREEAQLIAQKDQEHHPEQSAKIEHLMENVYKTFNKIPELMQYSLPESEDLATHRGTKEKNDGTAVLDIEQRDDTDIVTVIEVPDEPQNRRERKPRKTHKKRVYSIRVAGKRYSVTLQHENLNDENLPFAKDVVDHKIVVYVNIGFVGYKVATKFKNEDLYNIFLVSEALSDLYLENRRNPDHTLAELKWIIFRSLEEGELDRINKREKEMLDLRRKSLS